MYCVSSRLNEMIEKVLNLTIEFCIGESLEYVVQLINLNEPILVQSRYLYGFVHIHVISNVSLRMKRCNLKK